MQSFQSDFSSDQMEKVHFNFDSHLTALDDVFASSGEWLFDDHAVGDMTSDVAGGSMDLILEGALAYAGAGDDWKLSPEEDLLEGTHFEAGADDSIFASLEPEFLYGSYFQTSREQKKTVNSVPTASGIDACCEENSFVPETCTMVSTSMPLASPSFSKTAPSVSGNSNYSGSSSEDPLSVEQNPFGRKTLAGGMTVMDSIPFHLDDGALTADSKSDSLILLPMGAIVQGTEEEAACYAESDHNEGFISRSMDITESSHNVAGTGTSQLLTESVESYTGFESFDANVFHDHLDFKMYITVGSTPSEHTTTSPPPGPTTSSDSEMDSILSNLLSVELAELNESEAGLLHMHEEDHSLEMEQSLPSDGFSVGLTPWSSGTSEMELKSTSTVPSYLFESLSLPENVPPTDEEFASESTLLLHDTMTWSETEHQDQPLHGDHSPCHWPEMVGTFNIGEGMKEYYHAQNYFHSSTSHEDPNIFLNRSFVPVTPVIMEVNPENLSALISVSSDDVGVSKKCDEVILIPSSGSANADGTHHGEGIQETENVHRTDCDYEKDSIQETENLQRIDCDYEKDCILSKMLGKRTARTAPGTLDEELLRIVQDYQERITLITNKYCARHNRRVRYLPDFCKKALSEWVQIDAHQRNPYPEKEEIQRLADELGLTSAQVEQWFENYRVRSWNPQPNGIRKGKFFRYPIETTAILKKWILDHTHEPNPKGNDLVRLMEKTGMTPGQVKQWCYNFRRRHKSEML